MDIKDRFNAMLDPSDDKRQLDEWLQGSGRTVLMVVAGVILVWTVVIMVSSS